MNNSALIEVEKTTDLRDTIDYEDLIAELRGSINKIDREIITLLSNRFRMIERIGAIKSKVYLPIKDHARESHVLDQASQWAVQCGLPAHVAVDIVALIMQKSVDIQIRNQSNGDIAKAI